MNTIATFYENKYYHVFNRSNNKEELFHNQKHKNYFLKRYRDYLFPYVYTHAYSLLGNHFHFSIKVKSFQEIKKEIKEVPKNKQTSAMKRLDKSEVDSDGFVDNLTINQFQNFFNSYAKAINKDLGRKGSLFQKKFKRSIYDPEVKFRYLRYYIHHNVRKHGLVNDFKDYLNHSYFEIVAGESSLIDMNNVIQYFGSLEKFKSFHHMQFFENDFREFDIDL